MSVKLHIEFHPQAWVNDYAIDVDPEGPTIAEVEFSGVEIPEDNSYESDDLRHLPGCPTWWAEWSGPFWVCILNRAAIKALQRA